MGWLVPVGTPGGVNSGLDGIPRGSGIIRLGQKLVHLDLDLYRLWRAAAAVPQTAELITWGTDHRIGDIVDSIGTLIEAGLLVEQGADVQDRIGRLAVRFIGECLGNGNDAGSAFQVIGRTKTVVQVDAYLFEVLLRCDGVSQILMLCNALDAARPRPGTPPCIEVLTTGLPILIRNEVIQLEAAE